MNYGLDICALTAAQGWGCVLVMEKLIKLLLYRNPVILLLKRSLVLWPLLIYSEASKLADCAPRVTLDKQCSQVQRCDVKKTHRHSMFLYYPLLHRR